MIRMLNISARCKLIFVILITNLILSQGGESVVPQRRIVGGQEARIEFYPYMVSIHIDGGGHLCGATLLAPYWLLTAAHCGFKNPKSEDLERIPLKKLRAFAGSTIVPPWAEGANKKIGQVRKIVAFYPHDDLILRNRKVLNDVAVMQVYKQFDVDGRSIVLVPLPGGENPNVDPIDAGSCAAAGWGRTDIVGCGRGGNDEDGVLEDVVAQFNRRSGPMQLLEVSLPVTPINTCRAQLSSHQIVPHEMLCTFVEAKHIAKGDSGGPLMCNDVQWGITSWAAKCRQNDTPSVWMRVDHYLGFIRKTMKKPLVSSLPSLHGDSTPLSLVVSVFLLTTSL